MKKTNKILSILLVIAMMLTIAPISVFAADNLTDSITGVTLKDTDDDGYYEIETDDQLYAFANLVNAGNTAINAELTSDIVLNENVIAADGTLNGDPSQFTKWIPIGNKEAKYSGVFDGGKHTISGLFYHGTGEYAGFFGNIEGVYNSEEAGFVKDLGIVDSYFLIESTERWFRTGGIVGFANKISVKNCYVIANFDLTTTYYGPSIYIGGIGGMTYYADVRNCYTVMNVSLNYKASYIVDSVGGITAASSNEKLINCHTNYNSLGSYNTGTDLTGTTYNVSKEKFKSGEITYLLNGSTSASTSIWKQTIGEEDYPSFNGKNVDYDETKGYYNVAHVHSFYYSASDNTITAICTGEDCYLNNADGGYVTLSAPADICTDGNAVVDNQLADKSTVVNVVYSTDNGSVPTEDGTYTASVTLGDATATVEFTLGHDMIIDEAVEPTCTETGLTEGAHCSRCDEATTEQEIVPALGHDWSNKDGICANGCGENCEHENYIDGVCDYCGYECTHDWNEGVLTRPERITTTEWYDGYYTYTCTLCGDEKTETAKRADYTEFEETYSKVLGYLNGSDLTNEAKAEIHDAVQDYLSANPEFNDNGNVRGTLIESEQAIVDDATAFAKQILAIIEGNLTNCESGNHDVRNYTSNNNATCTENGTKTGNCYVCGEEVVETDENNLAFDHDYDYENGVLTRPTETEKGYYTYTCKNDANHTTTKEVDSADYTEYDKAAQKIAGYFSTPNLTDASKQLIIAELNKFAQNNSEYCDKNGNLRRDLIASEQDIVDNATRAANELIQVVDGLLANCEAGNHDVRKYTSDNNVTCTENGTKRGNCVVCGEEVTVDDENAPAPGHDMITDEAIEPTCTETGLTEGSHCSRCDEATTEQEIVPALGHDMITDEAVEPTCTETGLTEGSHCSRCDEATTEQEIVPALGHTPLDAVEENYVAPDCTNDGSKDMVVYCDVCDEELEREPVTIPALGHDMITDEAVEPTCTETGLTKGAHCSRCDEATTEQEVIDALGHDYEAVVTEPTYTERGYTTYTCTVCGDTYVDNYVDALGYGDFFSIRESSHTSIRNRDKIVLYALFDGELPEGTYVEWTADNDKFKTNDLDDGKLEIEARKKGTTVFTATLYDADGNELATETVEMYSDSGFFKKIGGFFRAIFGSTLYYNY